MPSLDLDDRVPLTAHLEELRSRLFISLIAIGFAMVVTFVFSDTLIAVLKAPAGKIALHAFSPMDGFMVKWRVALFGGLALAFPFWAYELIQFVSPGLTKDERRVIIPLVGVAFVLFALGIAFGYYMLYGMITVLLGMFGSQIDYVPSADGYIAFVTFFMLATGIAFELPVVLYALVRLNIISTELLRKQRRYFYFGLFVFAEIITPVSDPIVAPLTVMIPLVLLYEATVIVAVLGEKARARSLPHDSPGPAA